MRFTRDQLRAAVEAGRLSEPRAVEYLVDTLAERQRATGRYWFSRVAPLDHFAFVSDELCFDDLALEYTLLPAETPTHYTLTSFDVTGRTLAPPRRVVAGPTGYVCSAISVDDLGEGYTVIKATIERAEYAGTTYVHVARDPHTREPRVIGIWRP